MCNTSVNFGRNAKYTIHNSTYVWIRSEILQQHSPLQYFCYIEEESSAIVTVLWAVMVVNLTRAQIHRAPTPHRDRIRWRPRQSSDREIIASHFSLYPA